MLDFYREHRISPVTQAIPDLDAHFSRRAFLYRSLGLPPMAIQGTSVLEVGPGSGQNALYTASLKPARYVLMEPNETGRAALEATLRGHACEISSRSVETSQGADPFPFDVVLCEGLLGLAGRDPRALLTALREKVAVGGVLVITCIDAISQCSDVLRRAMAQRYIRKDASLQENLDALRPVFTPHLATLKGMTRSVDDWILDNILNPASIGPTFSIPDALEALEGSFCVLGCSPRFLMDWRWYKDADTSNQWAIDSYWRNCHNLFDYRRVEPEQTEADGRAFMANCVDIREQVFALERGDPSTYATGRIGMDPAWHGRGQQYLSLVRVA